MSPLRHRRYLKLVTAKRIMYKVAGVAAVPGTLSLMSGTVFAATEDKPNVTLNTDELSLYTTPQQKFRYVEPDIGHLEQGVTTLRKLAEPYVTWCQQTSHSAVEKVQGAIGKVKPKVESAIQLGSETFTFLQNPPAEFYPRLAVIGFSGIIGLFLARGSRVKKLVYPTGLMAAGYSMYYPQAAASIAKNTGDSLYDFALQGYVNVENVFKSATTTVEGKPMKNEKPEEKSPTAESKP
ncbi:MICOS complex subunit MIC26 isoform X1 [Coregonus clupeaformis]|uniref:MICOS complex subunit MIC26 isoform X1 n=2 Tax=Coregonus clupeaformis TaxID=59861 RepID=UPI001BE0388F|nr:MICOS complex subunit MIC26 isoform X1 [Coregonus clupeaformis]